MPSTSESQRKFFGAELGRERKGEKTDTGLPEHKLEEFAKKPIARQMARPRKKPIKKFIRPRKF